MSKDRETPHSLLLWPKQTWLSELKTLITDLGIGNQRREACKHFVKGGEKVVSQTDHHTSTSSPDLHVSTAFLLQQVTPSPFGEAKGSAGAWSHKGVVALCCSLVSMCFLCSGRENSPNAIMLGLFYINLSYILTANAFWTDGDDATNLIDCMYRMHIRHVWLHCLLSSHLYLLVYYFLWH